MSENFSVKELPLMLGVSTRHVRRMQAGQELPAPWRVGRLVRWLESEIIAWMHAGCPHRRTWEQIRRSA